MNSFCDSIIWERQPSVGKNVIGVVGTWVRKYNWAEKDWERGQNDLSVVSVAGISGITLPT